MFLSGNFHVDVYGKTYNNAWMPEMDGVPVKAPGLYLVMFNTCLSGSSNEHKDVTIYTDANTATTGGNVSANISTPIQSSYTPYMLYTYVRQNDHNMYIRWQSDASFLRGEVKMMRVGV